MHFLLRYIFFFFVFISFYINGKENKNKNTLMGWANDNFSAYLQWLCCLDFEHLVDLINLVWKKKKTEWQALLNVFEDWV